jgi:tRNA (mo5U34)-methyltransferase
MSRAERQAQADAIPFWWHSIELGEGAVSRGHKTPERHAAEVEALALPDLGGRSVLDIGAWDGFYSFHAEERGAARVVALDHFVWGVDMANDPPNPYPRLDLDGLPGRRGFDLAHRLRASRVEPVVGDLMTMDLARLGTFDVVLFLGVLYPLQDPLGALRRLREVTGGLAVIETHAIAAAGLEDRALWQLYPGDELDADPTSWWGPSERGLLDACRAAGFASAEVVHRSPSRGEAGDRMTRRRMVAHARPPETGSR